MECHDSELAEVVPKRDGLLLVFQPGYVHRSAGNPASDAGTGWLARVEVFIGSAGPIQLVAELPVSISDGSVMVDSWEHHNVFPLLLNATGQTRLRLQLGTGEWVDVAGTSITARAAGAYVFVEDVPAR